MSTPLIADWGFFNDHLAGMSDEELGQRLAKIKTSPWTNNWRWHPFRERMQSEFDKRAEPWTHWNEFPEERVGIGTAYINRQLESGQSIEDIKQKAADKNWIIGPDALDKFYSPLELRDINLQVLRDRARKPLEDRKSLWGATRGWEPPQQEGYPSPEVRGHHPTSGPTNVLKISGDNTNTSAKTTAKPKSKKQKSTYTTPTVANTLNL